MDFTSRKPHQAPGSSPVLNDKPFSIGCVFWFAIIGFILTCVVVLGGRTFRALLPAEFGELNLSTLLNSVESSSTRVVVTEFQTVTIAGKPYRLEVVRTDAARERGLSDRVVFPPKTGMRFVFPTADRYPFWMNKMRFSIDMVFLNDGTIVNIASKVPYPKTPTEEPAKVIPLQAFNEVIELPAGDADKLGLKIGQQIQLP